jgi:hypothetical protein
MEGTLFDTVARREEPIENIIGGLGGKIETRIAVFTSLRAARRSLKRLVPAQDEN